MYGGPIFEITKRDGMGRLGRITTAHGEFETPTLMPVIDPADIIIKPSDMRREFGSSLVITNAYLTMLHFGTGPEVKIHRILDYDGPIMTDSGGYQILMYGSVKVTPEEIISYQDSIAPDIATILDIPTGVSATREFARETVDVTLARAKQAVQIRSNPQVAWCGPIQGGVFTDLVEESATEMGKLDYPFHAIGSPVELLNGYRYAEIVDLVMAAKRNLPLERPVHLFGAGHPMMLALSAVMGCDLFDSAAYILFARDGRYMTSEGTLHLEELSYFPCECPVCTGTTPQELRREPEREKVKLLARHNLHVTFGEIRRIRQAILEGRLWEHVQARCRSHPSLLDAFRRLMSHSGTIEKYDPVTKKSAFYYSGEESARRPEVLRHKLRMAGRYSPPGLETLAIIPIFENNHQKTLTDEGVHLVKLIPPFGVVPEELDEIYPLAQNQGAKELDSEQLKSVAESLSDYLKAHGKSYRRVVLFDDGRWGDFLEKACEPVSDKLEIAKP